MDSIRALIEKKWFAALLCLLACLVYYFGVVNRAYVELSIQVKFPTDFKVYWAEAGKGFSEKKMARVRVRPDKIEYRFFLTDLNHIERLRIDPVQYAGTSRIERLIFTQKGLQPINFADQESWRKLSPLTQIKEFTISDQGLTVVSAGLDGNLLYTYHPELLQTNPWSTILRCIGIAAAVFFIHTLLCHLIVDFRYVPSLLVGVFFLVATMVVISEHNVHPDEFVHVAASNYYIDNWLPPQIDDERIANTYSPYGFSRLNSREIYYLLDGKFAKFLEPFHLDSYLVDRSFNVALLFMVLLYAFNNITARYLAIPFLISPQIWYTFSYCNSDAFALFIAYVVSCQVVDRNSSLYRVLQGQVSMAWLARLLGVALLFGLLFLLKKNYYPFILIVFFMLALEIWQEYAPADRRTLVMRLVTICVLGLSLLLVKTVADYKVNGFDRQAKIMAMQLKKAEVLYHPDTPLAEKHMLLYMKARGITLKQIIQTERWFEKTFRSAFGVYGYFTISGTYSYYDLVRWTSLALLACFLSQVYVRGDWQDRILATGVLAASFALIATSVYHSWNSDFQAQGRYLLPIFFMLALLFGKTRHLIEKRVFTCAVVVMFLLSSYSFIFYALHNIPRSIVE